jgi:large subunit ribosomal protein L25
VAESFNLDAQPRTIIGKKVSQLRTQGLVPAVIYGTHIQPISVQIPYRPLQVALSKAGGTHLIDISVGSDTQTVLARHVQRDVMSGGILHVDFLALDMNTKIQTEVPVHFVNESPAVSQRRGVLLQGVNTLTIEALPRDLISQVDVDISGLSDIGDSIHIRDLSVPGAVTIIDDAEEMIVRIAPVPTVTEDEATTEGGAAEPEVIARGKADEEEE